MFDPSFLAKVTNSRRNDMAHISFHGIDRSQKRALQCQKNVFTMSPNTRSPCPQSTQGGPGWGWVTARLFPDAELAEDAAQDFLDVHPARDPPERPGRQAQILG